MQPDARAAIDVQSAQCLKCMRNRVNSALQCIFHAICYNDKRYHHGSIQHCEFITNNVITVSACKHSSHKQKEVQPVDSVEHTTESFTLV